MGSLDLELFSKAVEFYLFLKFSSEQPGQGFRARETLSTWMDWLAIILVCLLLPSVLYQPVVGFQCHAYSLDRCFSTFNVLTGTTSHWVGVYRDGGGRVGCGHCVLCILMVRVQRAETLLGTARNNYLP